MCGRYTVSDEHENIIIREIINEANRRYFGTPGQKAMKTGEIFPTDTAPVLTAQSSEITALPMKWGFPRRQGSGVIINARAETALYKKIFAEPLLCSRCIIPAAGFYEWSHDTAKKEKYLIKTEDMSPLYMAGVYSRFAHKDAEYDSFVILTTEADDQMLQLHDRMPLMLSRENMQAWLLDDKAYQRILHSPIRHKLTITPAEKHSAQQYLSL